MNPKIITITSYNIHKGMSAFNRSVQINTIAAALKELHADLVFLQEVQGMHQKKTGKYKSYPFYPQDQVIARALNCYNSYGKNASFKKRHHGNAIVSTLPIYLKNNLNISTNTFEKRGMLHCQVHPTEWNVPLECLCAHLNLLEQDRQKQYDKIFNYINYCIDRTHPLILAGDFNDWNRKSYGPLEGLNLKEAFIEYQGFSPKTFPSTMPLLRLDRIFTRHLIVQEAVIHDKSPWDKLSDHLPISATLLLDR